MSFSCIQGHSFVMKLTSVCLFFYHSHPIDNGEFRSADSKAGN